MKLASFIGIEGNRGQNFGMLLLLLLLLVFIAFSAKAEKLAILAPEETPQSRMIESGLREKIDFLDADLIKSAFRSSAHENIYNLSSEEAKNLAASIGCGQLILLKAETLRRSSFSRELYFESYAVIYQIDSKTGHLNNWEIYSYDADAPADAEKKLFSEIENIASEIKSHLKAASSAKPKLLEFSEGDASLRPPLPFKRIRPEYTKLASLYAIAATIDIEIDINEKGEAMRMEILRWAGYGLDESVIEAVRRMKWRPATKDGKPLPIRVFLRYNFKKIEKEE